MTDEIMFKAAKVKLLITDCDGVLTDTGVYYSARGEEMKRFSIRDGMGVERLREISGVETAIMTGEMSESLKRRSEKLKIDKLYLGIKNKPEQLAKIVSEYGLNREEIAFIGDDMNDLEIICQVGFTGCPQDAIGEIKEAVDYICSHKGGNGAFREFADLIIKSKTH